MPAINHSGVVPWLDIDGERHVVLITNSSGLWGLPKGLIEDDLSAWDSAAKEALEEGGIIGRVTPEPVTTYVHHKWTSKQTVAMYLMAVDELLDEWDEAHMRARTVLDLAQARELVRPELAPVIEWAAGHFFHQLGGHVGAKQGTALAIVVDLHL